VLLRDTFGNAANFMGNSTIHLYSPNLVHAPAVSVSDTVLMYELSSTKVNRAAQVWIQRLTPFGLFATAFSSSSKVPEAQFLASTLDLPCNNCFVARPGQRYSYRFVCRQLVVTVVSIRNFTSHSISSLQMGRIYFFNTNVDVDFCILFLSVKHCIANHTVRFYFHFLSADLCSLLLRTIDGVNVTQDSASSGYIIGKAAVQANNFHSFLLTYDASPADVMFRAFILTQSASNQTLLGPIPASMLFSSEHLLGSPYDVTVVPSLTCAALSVASIVSIVTVGVSSTFSLEIKDSFHNFRTCESNQWVRFFGMEPIPGSYANQGLSCVFSFVPGSSTIGYVNILVDNSYVLPEASALVVLSGRLSLTRSTIRIVSMTTAGAPVSFSISLFDAVNNTKDLLIFSSNFEIVLQNLNHSRMKPFSTDVQPVLEPITKFPSFQFVVTVSAHFFVSVLFMNASFAQLPVLVVPASVCATTSSMIGDAVSLATNDATSQFFLQLRDSFRNEAFLDKSSAVYVYASTAPRFSGLSIMPMPSNSTISVSLTFRHASINTTIPLPQMSAVLSFVGGLMAT
jgi:hypothetical protein